MVKVPAGIALKVMPMELVGKPTPTDTVAMPASPELFVAVSVTV
jgi:hypothetical protein